MKQGSRQQSMSRRTVLAGAASVAAIGLAPPSLGAAPRSTSDIACLAALLEPMKRRCLRLHRRVRQISSDADRICRDRDIASYLPDGKRNPAFDAVRVELGYDATWQVWSAATNESLDLAERIRRTEAIDIEDLALKFGALLWLHYHDQMALSTDPVQLRQLRAFGRELARGTA
jgi:hypothetical protein